MRLLCFRWDEIKKTANFFVQVRGPGITCNANKKARDTTRAFSAFFTLQS